MLCARCLLPAACPACPVCYRLPEIQEPGDGRTKKNGCGSGSEEAADWPASQQAFLQLSTPARHRDTGHWGTKESGGLRLTATQATRLAPTQRCSWAEKAQAETHSQRQWAGGWASPLLAQMLSALTQGGSRQNLGT